MIRDAKVALSLLILIVVTTLAVESRFHTRVAAEAARKESIVSELNYLSIKKEIGNNNKSDAVRVQMLERELVLLIGN